MNEFIEKQKDFQRFVGFPIDSNKESDRNEMAEKYLFKAIEEIVELRREFPSVMNPWSKDQKNSNDTRIKEELSDVMLFLTNFMIVWKITPEELFGQMKKTQENNFAKIKAKKLDKLNQEILAIPGYTCGIGQGNVNPKYIFIGQNPGERITHGYKVWSNKEDGSSKVLLPILERLGILQDCYFTNVVKSATKGNTIPDENNVSFWSDYTLREIEILLTNNIKAVFIVMGKATSEMMEKIGFGPIYTLSRGLHYVTHPAAVLYGKETLTIDDYENEIKQAIE